VKPTFKSPNGALYTKQLFYELADTGRDLVLYTLKDDDHEGYPSIKRLYVELEDETEYLFATTYFHSWRHFKKLLDVRWFKDVIDEAREELAVKMAAKELLKIRQKSEQGDLRAAQYLIEQRWKPKESVGRPSKAKIKAEAERLAQDKSEFDDDLARIAEGFRA
jgi:hypothetical protein